MIPITILLVKERQDLRQRANGPLIIGMNVTGITDYGYNDLFHNSSSDVDADLKAIHAMGGTVVRVWVGNNQISDQEAANRLSSFLDKAANHQISAIVSFIDLYNTGFHPQGTDGFYKLDNSGKFMILDNDFFSGGYKDRYKSFVQTVINTNKNHSNIYAWEPGNELKDENNPTNFISFMQDMTSFIKNLDPSHKVATGMLRAEHTGLSPSQLYSVLPNIDIITIHAYNGDRGATEDVQWANSHGKQAIVEEIGIDGNQDRSGSINNELNYWKSQGVAGVLQWAFIAGGLGDNSNGDSGSGMDTIWHNADYNQLTSVYASYAGTPPPSSSPTPTPTPVPPPVGGSTCPGVGSTYDPGPGSTPNGDYWTVMSCKNSIPCNSSVSGPASGCPANTTDSCNINPDTSAWCYGFSDGNGCLQLRHTGTPNNTCGGGNGAPDCDASQLNMSASPNPVSLGNTIQFSLSGNQGSTWVGDNWTGGVSCNTNGFWGNKTCQTTNPGTFTWTHTWKNCAPGDCSAGHTSAECSKTLTFSVGSTGPSPSKLYLSTDPGSFSASPLTINPGGTFYVTTTSKNSAPDCSPYITLTPGGSSLTGYTCQGDGRGDTCSSNPVGDGNTCWWQWQCTAGSTPGNYPVTFSSGKSDYSLNPACEAQNTVAINNGSSPTPTPGGTITPTSSVGTQLAFTLNLPFAKQNLRKATFTLTSLNKPIATTSATLAYSNGNFTGTAILDPSVSSGTYDIYVKSTPYIDFIPGILITVGQTVTIDESEKPMILGDINGDGNINLQDYNALVSCNYGAVNPQPVTKDCQNADLNNDGVVDGIDYNIFIRGWNQAKSIGYNLPS